MSKTDYRVRIQSILRDSENPYEIFSLCTDMVNTHGRDGGILAYTLMNEAFKSGLYSEAEDAVLDTLEALTGYCADPIGTADYHLPNHAA
ncbi:hypothetical protein CBF16_22715 (plasmid) [Pantoea agglomerans]|uniref:hypothetical protein n=1 Tax=Enterobacter agglomerans TaxID=549 RepID=UPI000F5F0100|nr:hypothetical protein [Pantoea agglomerans]AZI53693.1 hypothetical protein CBF16_22715 [Pantoea agglomerans]